MLRILHTADWHLGKTLDERDRDEEHGLFFDFLLDRIVEERVDVLLMCGDLFDSANPPQRALAQYYGFLSRLRQISHCRVIIIAGNHDSPALLEAPRELLGGMDIHVVGKVPADPYLLALPNEVSPQAYVAAVPFLRDGDLRMGLSGQSIAEIQQELNDGIARVYERYCRECPLPLLAMGHLTVMGSEKSHSEREIHIGGLGALPVSRFPEGFCYIALGHLHRPQHCGGRSHIRYSGSPIPLSFSEANDRKEIRFVEIAQDGLKRNEGMAIPDFRRLIRIESSVVDALCWMKQIKEELEQRSSLLPAWIEIQLTLPSTDVELRQAMDDLAKGAEWMGEGKAFEVLRILPMARNLSEGVHDDANTRAGSLDALGDPRWIFERRLAQTTLLDDEQTEVLRRLFLQMLEQHGS